MILIIFFLKHNYDNWLENEKESTDTEESTDKKIDDEEELDDLPPLEGDKKKVKKGKGFYLQRKF